MDPKSSDCVKNVTKLVFGVRFLAPEAGPFSLPKSFVRSLRFFTRGTGVKWKSENGICPETHARILPAEAHARSLQRLQTHEGVASTCARLRTESHAWALHRSMHCTLRHQAMGCCSVHMASSSVTLKEDGDEWNGKGALRGPGYSEGRGTGGFKHGARLH